MALDIAPAKRELLNVMALTLMDELAKHGVTFETKTPKKFVTPVGSDIFIGVSVDDYDQWNHPACVRVIIHPIALRRLTVRMKVADGTKRALSTAKRIVKLIQKSKDTVAARKREADYQRKAQADKEAFCAAHNLQTRYSRTILGPGDLYIEPAHSGKLSLKFVTTVAPENAAQLVAKLREWVDALPK